MSLHRRFRDRSLTANKRMIFGGFEPVVEVKA